MTKIKTADEIKIMREGGKRLADILGKVLRLIVVGVSTADLNKEAEKLIKEDGDIPAFLNYTPHGALRPYPAALCVSVNDEVVHSIPNESPKILKEGDIVGLDLGLKHKGLVVDSAVTVGVGKISKDAQKLIYATKEALSVGIKASRAGKTIGDIGYAIGQVADRYGYNQPQELGGHGVGKKVQEDPFIANFGERGKGMKLKAGMTLALEPMLIDGGKGVEVDEDGYTVRTADHSLSAHFEHTILITDGNPEILTEI